MRHNKATSSDGQIETPQPAKKGRHTVRNVLVVAIVVVAALAAISCAGGSNDAVVDTSDGTAASQNVTNANTSDGQADASKYTITDESLSGDSYSATISGTFTNTSGKELSYVGVTYNLYDADGNQIGNAYANTNNLADGGSWKYDAYCTESLSDIASFKLGDVTAY